LGHSSVNYAESAQGSKQAMGRKRHPVLMAFLGVLLLAIIAFLYYRHIRQPITITGAVVIQDVDFRKQLPIPGVEIKLKSGLAHGPVKSDAQGFFSLRLFKKIRRGEQITLQFRHENYLPLDLTEPAQNKIYIARMVPIARAEPAKTSKPPIIISNVRTRYTTKTSSSVNVGSEAKTFDVPNVGDVPCNHAAVCSPDGKWKAAVGSLTLDAGTGNTFQDARVSCIAGPCPFTKIDSQDFSSGGQKVTVTVRNWSDTTTFLVEAEVMHTMTGQIDYLSYPVIFGTALSFTLPPQSEGVSLEADILGQTIIFPLGPDLLLSWANCSVSSHKDQTRVYRCELKPGYRFR
jgi:hypothetical protein